MATSTSLIHRVDKTFHLEQFVICDNNLREDDCHKNGMKFGRKIPMSLLRPHLFYSGLQDGSHRCPSHQCDTLPCIRFDLLWYAFGMPWCVMPLLAELNRKQNIEEECLRMASGLAQSWPADRPYPSTSVRQSLRTDTTFTDDQDASVLSSCSTSTGLDDNDKSQNGINV